MERSFPWISCNERKVYAHLTNGHTIHIVIIKGPGLKKLILEGDVTYRKLFFNHSSHEVFGRMLSFLAHVFSIELVSKCETH